MQNSFYHEKRDDYLYFKAIGERNNLSDVVSGSTRLYETAQKLNESHILADYRELIFNVPITEAYNLVRVYENKHPRFYDTALVCVTNPMNLELIKFWVSVSRKRGFNTNVFLTIEEAEEWLKKQS